MALAPLEKHTWSLVFLATADETQFFPIHILDATFTLADEVILFMKSIDHVLHNVQYQTQNAGDLATEGSNVTEGPEGTAGTTGANTGGSAGGGSTGANTGGGSTGGSVGNMDEVPLNTEWCFTAQGLCTAETWHDPVTYRVPVTLGRKLQFLAQTLQLCWDFCPVERKYDPAFHFQERVRAEGLATSVGECIPVYLLALVSTSKKIIMLWDCARRERHGLERWTNRWKPAHPWTTTPYYKCPFQLC